VGNIAREGVQGTHRWSGAISDVTDEWLLQWRMIQLDPLRSQSLFQFVEISNAYFVHLLLQYSLHVVINLTQIWQIWCHRWGGINSGLSSCNNLMVARAWWTLQVTQGSIKTLFRWGEKRLYHFAANLFRKRCTKLYQNRPSFVEDITKNMLVFFSGHTV